MKKIINNKLYSTDTARELGQDSYSNPSDFNYWREVLYQKRTGEYFLYGEGGPMSRYAHTIDQNSWSGGEQIMPLSAKTAREWAEKHLSADDYAQIFGLPDEDAEDVVLYAKVPAQIMAKLKDRAAENGTSVTEIVNSMLREYL